MMLYFVHHDQVYIATNPKVNEVVNQMSLDVLGDRVYIDSRLAVPDTVNAILTDNGYVKETITVALSFDNDTFQSISRNPKTFSMLISALMVYVY